MDEREREREREVLDQIFPQTILLTNSLVRKNATFQSVSGWRGLAGTKLGIIQR